MLCTPNTSRTAREPQAAAPRFLRARCGRGAGSRVRGSGSRKPTADSRQLTAFGIPTFPHSHFPTHGSAGFTLIEMIVVVAIIGLLLAISVPASMGLVNSQKAKATKATMQTLELAIQSYASERPISDKYYADRYGAFPPSPATAIVLSAVDPSFPKGGPSGFENGEYRFATRSSGTKEKFWSLGRGYLVPPPLNDQWYYNNDSNWHETDYPATDKYLSIETLLLFLRERSPQARQSLDRMQKNTTNKDTDRIAWDADGDAVTNALKEVDLFEINDAWGNALRYAVQAPVVNKDGMALKIRWELRSAGADGKFEPTFGPYPSINGEFADESFGGDDVILRGP